jgi:hypothetical protein
MTSHIVMTTPRPSANAPSRQRQSTHPHADEPLLVGWVVDAPEPEDDGDNDDEPHAAHAHTHAHAHAYKPLLVGWFMCAVSAREEGDDAPSTRPPLLRALARRVEWVLTVMSPPPR